MSGKDNMKTRCSWCGSDPLYISYHDDDWGVPVHDDTKLFEMLVLEGAQAGLSWLTVLKKRQSYREAFDNFDIQKVANYGDGDVERLLVNPGIIRNRLKIASAIRNAAGVIRIQQEFGSLDSYLWNFTAHKTIRNSWNSLSEVPARTTESDIMSRDLKKRGFNFVGSTICYAFMQSIGMVNDHIVSCFRHQEID